jgi:hypothetical protein
MQKFSFAFRPQRIRCKCAYFKCKYLTSPSVLADARPRDRVTAVRVGVLAVAPVGATDAVATALAGNLAVPALVARRALALA